jgi:hypothetical protein
VAPGRQPLARHRDRRSFRVDQGPIEIEKDGSHVDVSPFSVSPAQKTLAFPHRDLYAKDMRSTWIAALGFAVLLPLTALSIDGDALPEPPACEKAVTDSGVSWGGPGPSAIDWESDGTSGRRGSDVDVIDRTSSRNDIGSRGFEEGGGGRGSAEP